MAKYDILFPFLGAGVGGSHIATFRLGKALNEQFGLRSVVLCVAGSRVAQEAVKYGLDAAGTGEPAVSRNNPLYDLTRVLRRTSLLRRLGGSDSIVHTNDIEATQSWGPCAKLAGMKLVYQHQSLNRNVLPNRITLAFPDAFIAVSDACLRNLSYVDQGKITKVHYCYSVAGVDRAAARRRVLSDCGAPEEAILLGFVGNFWNRKRPHFFLDAASVIAAREPRAYFLMFGRAGENTQEDLEAYARKIGVRERVRFMGFRSPPEENIAALDLLLAPAINEPFGLAPVESLLLGTPYVVTGDAGHLESAERWGGGLIAPKEASPAEFAETALSVLGGRVSPALTPARRAEIAAELSPRVQAETVLGIYRRLAPRA